MSEPGHVFVVQADLTKLACDDVLIPTDAFGHVMPTWRQVGNPPLPRGWGDHGVRVTSVASARNGMLSRARWVNAGSSPSRANVGWLREGVQQAFEAVAGDAVDGQFVHGRSRRLVGLPAFGTGAGGFDAVRGEALDGLLRECHRAAVRHGFDVVLTCWHRSDYAAVQMSRARHADTHEGLSATLLSQADRLGALAAEGRLALFLGAGLSKPAGLPTWPQLIARLAHDSPAYRDRLDELVEIPPPDAALLLKRESPDNFRTVLHEALKSSSYAVGHALVASLRAHEAITTNLDSLYEQACEVSFRASRLTTLPWERAVPGRPWLLKMHGDIERPEVVLSRDEFLGYDALWRPLASVVQSAMMTRHVLFIGYSLTDENYIRLGRNVSELFDRMGIDRLVGTVLSLQMERLRAELWEGDLLAVPMAVGSTTNLSDAARLLEIFLDRVAMKASESEHSYLMDPRYWSLTQETDHKVVATLGEVGLAIQRQPSTHWDALVKVLESYGMRPSE